MPRLIVIISGEFFEGSRLEKFAVLFVNLLFVQPWVPRKQPLRVS